MPRDSQIRRLSRTASAYARWQPGSRAEKLAQLATLAAKARRLREQADQVDEQVTTALGALDTQDGRA